MIRTQVQLTEEQARDLKELAEVQNVSMAELVRRAIDRYIADNERRDRRRRALAAIGRFRGDQSDVGVNHDAYLADEYLA